MAALTMSMAAAKPALVGSSKSAFKGSRVSAVAPKKVAGGRATLQVRIDAADDAARAPRRTPSDATRRRQPLEGLEKIFARSHAP